mgnify:CR=1 FL=1
MTKSKSAYSEPTKLGKEDHHIIVVWVDNEAGVLARVIGLFSGRGYNIESLAVAEVDKAENCYPMIPSGKPHNQMLLGPEDEKEEVSDEGKTLV